MSLLVPESPIVPASVEEHAMRDMEKWEYVDKKLNKLSEKLKEQKEDKEMLVERDVVTSGGCGHDGFGGGGIFGGLLLGALLRNNNGVFGGNGDGGNAVNQITLGQIQGEIADVKAAVPLAEAQVQLALAGASADINSNTLQQTIALQNTLNQNQLSTVQNFANTGDKIDNVAALSLAGFAAVNSNIDKTGWQLAQTITNDGDKTRALISQIDRDNLNRQLTVAENALAEERAERSRAADRHNIEIAINNNQNQNQLQFQAQNQLLSQLATGLIEVGQIARATNSNLIVGSTGVHTGAQNANPTNVRA